MCSKETPRTTVFADSKSQECIVYRDCGPLLSHSVFLEPASTCESKWLELRCISIKFVVHMYAVHGDFDLDALGNFDATVKLYSSWGGDLSGL